jgi:hypothetical protein
MASEPAAHVGSRRKRRDPRAATQARASGTPAYSIVVAVDEETDADGQPFVNSYRREDDGDAQRQPGVIACLCRWGARAEEKMLPRDVS